MKRRRATHLNCRLRTIAQCLTIIVALSAVAATDAQALPNWMLPPTESPGPGLVVGVEAKVEKALELLSKVGTSSVGISCEKLTLDKGLLETEGKSSATLLFTGCQTLLNGKSTGSCKPAEPITSKVKGLLVLHESVAHERIEPTEGKAFTAIKLGTECAIGEEFTVKGVFYAKETSGKLEVAEEAHSFSEGPLTSLSFGLNPATIDGSASLSLTGEHLHKLWSGLGA